MRPAIREALILLAIAIVCVPIGIAAPALYDWLIFKFFWPPPVIKPSHWRHLIDLAMPLVVMPACFLLLFLIAWRHDRRQHGASHDAV
jgi:hypothetical protein